MPSGPLLYSRAKACGRDVKRAVAIRSKLAVVPSATAPGDEFHATGPTGKPGGMKPIEPTGPRHAEWCDVFAYRYP